MECTGKLKGVAKDWVSGKWPLHRCPDQGQVSDGDRKTVPQKAES